VGDTRRAVGRTAAQLAGTPQSALGLPGIPTTGQFPNTLPRVFATPITSYDVVPKTS